MTPDLTISMATVNDFDGVYFTIQGIRTRHDCSKIEFVVVDNKPDSPASKPLERFLLNMAAHGTAGVKYIPMPTPKGTAPPRNRAIREAAAKHVLHVDSHILLLNYFGGQQLDPLETILDYWRENPESDDIISGPLVMDDLQTQLTHFDAMWSAQMWGRWGTAWACKCYNPTTIRKQRKEGGDSLRFSLNPLRENEDPKTTRTVYRGLVIDYLPVTFCPKCKAKLPECYALNARTILRDAGYKEIGRTLGEPAFEIPGQGLGLFSVRRDSWLGFNENFRGFGGEELYIHTKYNQHGRKAICIPDLKWMHRFGRPNGVSYPLTQYLKVRNYVIGFQELGLDVEDVRKHFMEELPPNARFPKEKWDHLLLDPVANEKDPATSAPQTPKADQPTATMMLKNLEDLYAWCMSKPRDLDKHMPTIREYASKCATATEIGKRRESTVALAAGGVKLTSYNQEFGDDAIFTLLQRYVPEAVVENKRSEDITAIADTDLLFIDSVHTESALTEDLQKYAKNVKRFIILHDTALYGEKGEDGGGGLRTAFRKFMRKNQEWSVIYHSQDQYGLTILGCQAQDKPKMPTVWRMAENFLGAVADFVGDGAGLVDKELFEARLNVCSECPQRVGGGCAACGCNLTAKAKIRSQGCPLAYWPDQQQAAKEAKVQK